MYVGSNVKAFILKFVGHICTSMYLEEKYFGRKVMMMFPSTIVALQLRRILWQLLQFLDK